jgi:hypothetical protein
MTRPTSSRLKGPGCPVCGLPIPSAATADDCQECGWRLRGPHVLGDLTADVVREFDERLGAAGRAFDLRAAARVEAALGAADPGIASRIFGIVRAAPPTAGEVDAARAQATAPPPGGAPIPTLTTVVAEARSRLNPPGTPGGARPAVLEVAADGVSLTVIELDGLSLAVAREVERWEWTQLLTGLPADREARLLQLAGGVGSAAPTPGAGAVKAGAVKAVVETASSAGATELVVASRLPAGWPLPGRFEAELTTPDNFAAALSPRRCHAWPGESVRDALVEPSTALAYDLVVAAVDPTTQRVTLTAVPAFPAGQLAQAGRAPTAEIPVTAPRSGLPLALVVVARPPGRPPGSDDPRTWQPVTIVRCSVPPGTPGRVLLSLADPRTVTFLEPDGAEATVGGPSGSPGLRDVWLTLLDELPSTYGSRPADVALLVETSGKDEGVVAARLGLLARLLDLLATEHSDPENVQVSVIGYRAHDSQSERVRRRPAVTSLVAVPPAEAAREVKDWRPSLSGELAAPVEDALHEAGLLPWREHARAVLITLGSRGPHPPEQEADLVWPCPDKRDWEFELRQLVQRVGPARVAVGGPVAGVGLRDNQHVPRALQAWKQLGAQGHLAAAAGAREVAERSGLFDNGDEKNAVGWGAGAGPAQRQPARPLVFPLRADTGGQTAGTGGTKKDGN